MAADKNSALLQDPVTGALLRMAGPISLGMLSTFLFQVVDTYFVGQLGPNELAALSFSATTYFLAVALFMGMAVGHPVAREILRTEAGAERIGDRGGVRVVALLRIDLNRDDHVQPELVVGRLEILERAFHRELAHGRTRTPDSHRSEEERPAPDREHQQL